jgi:hypothetical protein
MCERKFAANENKSIQPGAFGRFCAVLLGLAAAFQIQAQDFGIKFLGGQTGDTVTGTAGVVPIPNWNNINNTTLAVGTWSAITSSDGSKTAALSLSGGSANNGWQSGLAGDGANLSLMDGYIDTGYNGNEMALVTISNLTAPSYDVYIYFLADNSRPENNRDWLPNYSVNGTSYFVPIFGNNGPTTYDTTGVALGGAGFTGFVEAFPILANNNSWFVPANIGNYLKIASVAPVGGVITIGAEADTRTFRSPLNGIELVTAAPTAPLANAPTEIYNSPGGASGQFVPTPGTDLTITASASGAAPITYQWQTDGGSGNTLTNIPGATGTNLVINTAGWAPGSYVYGFLASNSLGTNGSTTLRILVPATSPTPAIGVQFEGNGNSQTLYPGEAAGYVPHQFWNVDDQGSSGIFTNLVDSTGAATIATVTVTYDAGQYYSDDITSNSDGVLMSGGFWSGDGYTVNVTGIPYSTYDVYVYMLNDNNPNRRYALTLGSTTYWGAVFNGNGYAVPPYTLDTQSAQLAEGTQMQANLVEFTGITGSSFAITGQTPDGNVAMMALQITSLAGGPPIVSAPVISPTNTTIYAGTEVSLIESASGQAPLFYQWQSNGGSGNTLANVAGATSSNLTINTTSLRTGTYKYDVVVSNAFGVVTSSVATFNLVAANVPVLVSAITPSSAAVSVGSQQTFSAVFNGTMPITYQWQANTGSGMLNIPNATNTSLTLTNVQLANAGSYQLLAYNSVGGPASSGVATLTVFSAPAYVSAVLAANPVGYWRLNETNNPVSGTVVAVDAMHNFNGVYGSGAGDGVPGPTPSMGFPGFESDNTAAEFTNNADNSYVSLPALNLNTNTVTFAAWVYPIGTPADYCGIVFCRDDNTGDASGFNFTDGGQLGYTWNQNDGATWSWMSGLVPPSGQWSFVSLVISPSNAVAYLCQAGTQVSATNAVASDVEAFTVNTLIGDDDQDAGRVFNGVIDEVAIFNYALSADQLLNLYFSAAGGAPHVGAATASPSNNVYAGTTVTLSASVFGLEPFNYQWQRNGVNLAGATSATLIITNAQVIDSASYDVVVGNSSGTNQSAAVTLTVNPAGGPVFVQQPSPASVTNYVGGLVTFSAVVNGSPPIGLQWLHNGAILTNATSGSLTLAGLQLGESGTYTLVASNYLGITNSLAATLTVLPIPNPSALNVLTYHYDNTRDGANTNEYVLTPQNVNVNSFGRLFSYTVDGYIYASPLYVSGLVIPGQGTHNAVFVATEHNSVYAFDADSNAGTNGGLLWHTNMGASALDSYHEFGDRYNGNNYTDIVPEVGITGTPVISLANGTLYVDVRTRVATSTSTNYYNKVHALNITNGMDQPYSPVLVTNSVPGRGVDSVGGVVTFNPVQENQRPGLTLAGGMLYVAFGSFADTDPYHGWVIGFNATNLQSSANYVFNTSPNATMADFGGNAAESALWMGGNGLCVDSSNNLYFEVANGSFSAWTNGGDYGDSFVKLSTTNGLKVASYFTPYNQADMAAGDADLGSGGPILLPDSVGSTAHHHLIVGAGKEGILHLVDRDNMGGYNQNNDNQIVQEVNGAIAGAFSTPAYFNGQIYWQGSGDVTKAYSISNATLSTAPTSQATTAFGALGGTPVVSANGTNNGIVWNLQSDAFGSGGPVILHARSATNLAVELYNSSQNVARDNPGGAIQMTAPTVVNGKVFVGAQYTLSVFGNALFLATPSIIPGGGAFTNSVMVTLADATPNSSIYYTLDGTLPTTNSILYTGPFVLKNSTLVQAIAAEFGAVNSGLASASFVNTAATGNGTGLLGEYWANTSARAFTNVTFSAAPTLTRTDATINFNWSVTGPSPAVGQTNFTALWQGCVQPEYSETYTFTTIAQQGVQLWVNGQLLISAWTTNAAAQTNSATLSLNAQELYNVELKYFQTTGNAEAQLFWSSPSTPQAIIPQTQLYPFTNPPPSVALIAPANNATYTASASVTVSANAATESNTLNGVSFYLGSTLLGTVSNAPFSLTTTGLGAGTYTLTAVAVDGSGLSATSAPVNITVNPATGLPYGLTNLTSAPAFYNMPTVYTGTLPALLSQTGVFTNTPAMTPVASLIPYAPNVQLFSDNAQKIRYFSVPNTGAPLTPSEQITYAPTNNWSFPAGTVFVKTFELQTNTSDPTSLLRLETRLLVLDTNGAVYGVTYKWRADYSDADLLSSSQTEPVTIQTPNGLYTNLWYYPSPSDCLQCHTAVANYVLGANARQFNRTLTYSNGVTDNELRALNRAGLFNPAIDEATITNIEALSALTNLSASYQQRARSYLDANCAQCHQPGGTGPTFDARYDTPLAQQNIIGVPAVKGNLGYDNVDIVTQDDVWRSSLYDRMNVVNPLIQMPPLARNLIDTNAAEVMAEWINSLPGTPALPPPTLNPTGGTFQGSVSVTLEDASNNAAIYYTLDGSLPTTSSTLYTEPFVITNTVTLNANAWESGYSNSVVGTALFVIQPNAYFTGAAGFSNGMFAMALSGPVGSNYVLEVSTNLQTWSALSTNTATNANFTLTDPSTPSTTSRFYRVLQQP